jgi:hypothetical protein
LLRFNKALNLALREHYLGAHLAKSSQVRFCEKCCAEIRPNQLFNSRLTVSVDYWKDLLRDGKNPAVARGGKTML